jgi:hypothetical protein
MNYGHSEWGPGRVMSNSFSSPAENGKECPADITCTVIGDIKIVGVLAIIEKMQKQKMIA